MTEHISHSSGHEGPETFSAERLADMYKTGHTYACTYVQVNHSGTPETSHYGGTARSSEQAAGDARAQETSAEAQEPEAEEIRAEQPVRASARQKAAEGTAGAMQASLMVNC